MKRMIIALLCVALLLALPSTVLANEIPQADRMGSLTLRMEWEGKPLDSGNLTLTRVGQIVWKDGGYDFDLIPELENPGVSLENLNDPELPGTLAKQAQEKKLDSITASVEGGKAYFPDLQTGLYVVTQSEACDGLKPINPFLISLPRWDGKTYVYDLTADPKMALETEPTEPTEPTPTKPTEPDDPKLPQTGQLNWPIPIMLSFGMIFLTVGIVLCFKKRDRYET